MAHFRATIQGHRGEASRLGTKNSGIGGTCNGWNIGLRFEIAHINGEDILSIGVTGGSNSGWVRKDLGTFRVSDFEKKASNA